jgi:outer membrane protein, multidrug efflux system
MNSSSTQKFSLRTLSAIVAGSIVGTAIRLNKAFARSTADSSIGLTKRKGRRPLARRSAAIVLFPLFLLLSGCVLGPNYKRPAVSTPAAFRGPSDAAQQASLADLPWWQVFNDETLTELIKTCLANNYDLASAVARVEQASQVAAQARSQYFPVLSYSTYTSYGHNQFIYSPIGPPPGAQGFLLAIARVSWEADLWGRIRRTNEGARAQLLATEEARRGVMLTLASEVSQAYFELVGLRVQLDIAKQAKQSFESTLKLVTQRQQERIGNELQTSRAATDVANATASVLELERQIALKENQISVLLGKNPGTIETKAKFLGDVPPDVPAGLPSALLERRPDVQAAEQSMRNANAQIGVAQAAYFPTIGLTTFFGKLSTPLSDLALSRTNAWSLAASISGPLFNAGGITAQKRQSVAAWEQTRDQYLQTALNAFRDVSDALISREKIDDLRAQQSEVVRLNENSVRLISMRETDGQASHLDVLEARQRLYSAQLVLNQTEINRRLIIVQLYKALGGGWNLTDAQWLSANSQAGPPNPPPANKP